jgi:Transposase DDE domain
VDVRLPSIVPSCEPEGASGIRSTARKVSFPIPRLIPRPTGPNRAGSALVYGWKLHVVSVVAAVWFPIAAILTPANVANSDPAPELLREVPAEVRFVLGDRHYNTPDLHEHCEQADRLLVTTRYRRYPHTDDGVEVRRIFHKLRSRAMENFNEHFKGIFDGHGQVPTKGLLATQRFALGAIFVYQLAFLYGFGHHLELCVGLKAFLKAA